MLVLTASVEDAFVIPALDAGAWGYVTKMDADREIISAVRVVAHGGFYVKPDLARAMIRRIKRNNPQCKIVVTGCYAQRAPQEVAALAGVSQVIGNSHKHNLAQIVLREQSEKDTRGSFFPLTGLRPVTTQEHEGLGAEVFVSDIFAHTELLAAPVFDSANERTRPNLKVQDGCNNRCSFCIIPSVRGRSRSMSAANVVHQVRDLVESG